MIITIKRKKKKKKSLGFKIFLGFLFALLAFVIVGSGYFIGLLNKMNNVKLDNKNLGIVEDEFKDYENSEKIINIALLGIDATDGEYWSFRLNNDSYN